MVASSKILAVLGRFAFNAVDPGQMFFGPFQEVGEQRGDAITPEAVVAHQRLPRVADIAMTVGPRIPRRYIGLE